MSPSASANAITCCFSLAQVPSLAHRTNRVCAVFHGPYRSGMSRHGDPVRFTHTIPLMT